MNCTNENKCICPALLCPRHGKCCACVKNHREKDGLPFCIFPYTDGIKSVRKYYEKLKERFEGEQQKE